MKKILITVAILAGLSVPAQAFTVTKIGTVQSAQHNDLVDRMIKSDLKVWAGVDPDGYELVRFDVNSGLKNLKIDLWRPKEGDRNANILYGYEKWDHIFTKALQWGQIAQTNSVDHTADLGDCSTVDAKCRARFVSISDGKTVYVRFDMQSKENQFYTAKPVIHLQDIKTLDNLFRIAAPDHWKTVRDKATRDTSKLFK